MDKKNEIIVKDVAIRTISKGGIDYICITDIARQKNWMDPNGVMANWIRNRNTIEFLGIWETLYNPDFNPLEFEGVRQQAGLNAFTLSPSRWIESTNAIGIISQSGRYDGLSQSERLRKLNSIAIHQMSVLESNEKSRNLLKE